MRRLRISDESRADLDEIWWYIAGDNLRSADAVVADIVADFQTLLQFPGLGRGRDELRAGLRSFPAGSYLIFYRVLNDELEIVRVVHGARNVESIFKPES